MLESFTEVTELLRHFYAVLHRPGTVPAGLTRCVRPSSRTLGA